MEQLKEDYNEVEPYFTNLETKNDYIKLFSKFYIQYIQGFNDPEKFSNNKMKFNKI